MGRELHRRPSSITPAPARRITRCPLLPSGSTGQMPGPLISQASCFVTRARPVWQARRGRSRTSTPCRSPTTAITSRHWQLAQRCRECRRSCRSRLRGGVGGQPGGRAGSVGLAEPSASIAPRARTHPPGAAGAGAKVGVPPSRSGRQRGPRRLSRRGAAEARRRAAACGVESRGQTNGAPGAPASHARARHHDPVGRREPERRGASPHAQGHDEPAERQAPQVVPRLRYRDHLEPALRSPRRDSGGIWPDVLPLAVRALPRPSGGHRAAVARTLQRLLRAFAGLRHPPRAAAPCLSPPVSVSRPDPAANRVLLRLRSPVRGGPTGLCAPPSRGDPRLEA